MENKLLTVIVPAYNVEKYLEECLDSLVNQTVQDHFVIIVDDGSKDSTPEICDRYVEQYPELFYCIHQKNKGLGAARNTGMQYVKTPYFTCLDSDDWWDLNFVAELKKELALFPNEKIDLIYTLPTIYDTVRNVYYNWYDKDVFFDVFYTGNRLVSICEKPELYNLEYNANRRIYATEFSKRISLHFEEGVKWEDVYPHFYMTYHAKKCLGLGNVGFNYRTNTSTQITATSGRDRLDVIPAFIKIVQLMITEKMTRHERKIIFARIFDFIRWCIQSSNYAVRKELMQKVHKVMKAMPKQYVKEYFKDTPSRKEKLFIMVLYSPFLQKLYIDYLVKDKVTVKIKQLGGLIRRV